MTNYFDFSLRTHKWIHFVSSVVLLALLAGCGTTNGLDRNKQAAKELALLFRLYDQISSDPFFPETLHDVARRLKAAGYADVLPQCKCADGKMRDFIYIAGFSALGDAGGWAYLFSPPEMDSKNVIVISLDTTIKVMSREEADKEIEKSRAFLIQRNM